MRSSSIKTLVATLTIATTLSLALPMTAATRRTKPRPASTSGSAIMRIIRELIQRVGGITTNQGPTIPVGDYGTGPGTTGETMTDTGTPTTDPNTTTGGQ